ncbi:DUF397 domain-containing protein [Streptomyces xinghaiensis]|uniref:DUF397 domain-containing protein n=1 Tax=Streptomyces xinghaiensis TaxID=1038928 RepID=UPI002E0E5A13|nr:DUF397 domain-containing protein [Streptomyces xinghaiensis]
MTTTVPRDLSSLTWRKSSHSSGNGGECLEVADGVADTVPVRDSKDPQGPALTFPATAWTAFVTGIRTGRLF